MKHRASEEISTTPVEQAIVSVTKAQVSRVDTLPRLGSEIENWKDTFEARAVPLHNPPTTGTTL